MGGFTMNQYSKNKQYHAAIYVRLSKEDGDKEESDSIVNQKDFIKNYLLDKPDILICMECIDDGYSGVHFERPNFKRMMQAAESGMINCIVVKDLSRFGRNFIETGRYIEQVFPALGIRFIAINDGFDNVNGRTSSDRILIPFKNLINDAYCRDISIKIRSQFEIKRKKGEFIGAFAVYGYKKDPDNRHKLLIDEYAANVVRDIFKWKLDGMSQQQIAERLNERGELSPMDYKRSCGMNYQSGFQINTKAKWAAITVGRILKNEFYIGTLVQGKRTTPNHKVKKIIQKPYDEWIRIENNHTPIIDREDFYVVNRLLQQDMRVSPNVEAVYLFSGLVFCGDCGQNMVRNSVCRKGKSYTYYMCGNNRTNHECTSHRIRDTLLEESVLFSLKQHIGNILNIDRILNYIETLPLQKEKVQKSDSQRTKKQEEIARYHRLKKSLYESMMDGLISKSEYLELKAVYDQKIQEAQAAETKLKEEFEHLLDNRPAHREWIERFKQHQNITELTRHIAVTLIDHIDIYEGCRVNIHFQYQDSYEQALSMIEHINKIHPFDTSSAGNSVSATERGAV